MRIRTAFFTTAIALLAIGGGYLCFKMWVGDFAFHAGKRLYYEQQDYAAALDDYKQVKRQSVHYATAQRYIGHNIYGREWGQWSDGIPYLEKALKADPNDPKVLEDVGRAYVKVGRVNEGADMLRRANTEVAQTALALLDK